MKLRTKVFLMFTTLATIALLVFAFFTYERYTQTIYQRMNDFSSTLMDNAAKTANDTLDRLRQTAGAFNFYYNDGSSIIQKLKKFTDSQNAPDIWDYYELSKEFDRTCQNLLYSNEDIYGIYIFTPSGYVLESTTEINGTILSDYDFQNAKWYQETLKRDGALYISSCDTHSFFSGNQKSIFFTQCLKDVYTHEILGTLMIDCNADMLNLDPVNNMPDITLLTIDNTETNAVLYTNYKNHIHDFSHKNRKVQKTALNVKNLHLTMVVDYDSLFQEFNVTGLLMMLICMICIIGFITFAYFLTRYLVHPIEHLSRKMSSQKGHTLIQSTRYLDRTDEIGTLYNEYNSMVKSLNAAVKQDYQDKLVILDAQMKSLEARINSHFLFNTLESINSMAELEDNLTIADMSLALGNMFRYTLKTQSELVTIEEELCHVQDYVSIQQIRFDQRFQLIVDMTPEFKQKKVLKLILQPLVENSLYHGLNYCTIGDTISISGHEENSYIYITVSDNGQGMNSETLTKLRSSLSKEASFTELGHRNKQSIGLKNIHSRIELYYGQGYGLTITSELQRGTSILIKLPVLKQ